MPTPRRFITNHHFSSLARPAAAASHPTFRHDTLFVAPSGPLTPLDRAGSTSLAPDRSSAARRNATLFDTFRQISTRLSNSVESPRHRPLIRLVFALDTGCILKQGHGLFEIGFVPHFLFPRSCGAGLSLPADLSRLSFRRGSRHAQIRSTAGLPSIREPALAALETGG